MFITRVVLAFCLLWNNNGIYCVTGGKEDSAGSAQQEYTERGREPY